MKKLFSVTVHYEGVKERRYVSEKVYMVIAETDLDARAWAVSHVETGFTESYKGKILYCEVFLKSEIDHTVVAEACTCGENEGCHLCP